MILTNQRGVSESTALLMVPNISERELVESVETMKLKTLFPEF